MRVIITGGTGLIGHVLSYRLINERHEVIVLSRNSQAKKMPPTVQGARWDGYSSFGWGHLIDGNTVIINLAGENAGKGRWSAGSKHRILSSRVDSTEAVIEAMKFAKEKPALLIQASAVGYYGDGGDTVMTENTPAGEGFLADVAYDWEEAAKPAPTRVVTMRIGNVLSRKGGYLPSMLLAGRLTTRKLGSGSQWIPWIHIDDVANAVSFFINNTDTQGAYNVTSPNPVTNEQFLHALSQVLHAPRLVGVPSWALKLLLGEKADVVLDSQRVQPARLLEAGFRFQHPDIRESLHDLLGRHYERRRRGHI